MKLEIRTLETMGKRWIGYSPVIRSREAGATLVLACTERSSASAVGALRPRWMADVRAAAAWRLGLADNVQRRENRKSKRESRGAARRRLRSYAVSFFPPSVALRGSLPLCWAGKFGPMPSLELKMLGWQTYILKNFLGSD